MVRIGVEKSERKRGWVISDLRNEKEGVPISKEDEITPKNQGLVGEKRARL